MCSQSVAQAVAASRCIKEVEEFERTCDKRLEYDLVLVACCLISAILYHASSCLCLRCMIVMDWMIREVASSVARSSAQTEL